MSLSGANLRAGVPASDFDGRGDLSGFSSGASLDKASFHLALLLDRLAGLNADNPDSLQSALALGQASDLASAFHQLPPEARARLDEILPSTSRAALFSLSQEKDAELFGAGLLHWAGREERVDRIGHAALIYELLSHGGEEWGIAGLPEGLRRRAKLRLDAIEGRGAIGGRVEFLSRRFAASTGAFLLEAPSFTAFTRLAQAGLGQDRDGSSLATEVVGSYLSLGALRLGGGFAPPVFPAGLRAWLRA